MPNQITLASSQINGDVLSVELHRAEDVAAARRTMGPAVVIIRWPAAPSVTSPDKFPEVAAFLTRLFASAAMELAALKARRRTQ